MSVGLENRLIRLESKVRPISKVSEHFLDFDLFIEHLGLVPAAVHELALRKGSSLVEAMCEMLGIEVREFKDALRER